MNVLEHQCNHKFILLHKIIKFVLLVQKPIAHGKEEIPSAPVLQLSSANIDRTGLFLMDTGEAMYLLVGSGVGDQICQEVFDKPNFMSIPEGMVCDYNRSVTS